MKTTSDKPTTRRTQFNPADPRLNSPAFRARFASLLINTDDPAACWEWQGHKSSRGYGRVGFKGAYYRVHRLALAWHTGIAPDGLFACHRCDNPPCCNPAHLFWGTTDDNMKDAAKKNRMASNERSIYCRLSNDDVAEIRRRYAAGGITQAALAGEYGITQAHTSAIVRNLKRVTYVDGVRPEMIKHHPAGERCAQAKLTEEQVSFIRRMKGTLKATDLAEQFGVGHTHIRRLWRGERWKHQTS